jgi:hypothetical protein
MSKKSENFQAKNVTKNVKWENNKAGEASGVYHGIQDSTE